MLIKIFLFILVGGVAGWLAGNFMKGSGFGTLWNVIIGLCGGILGGWIFNLLGFSGGRNIIGSLIVSFVGAIVLLWIFDKIKNK